MKQPTSIELRSQITRADGTVEPEKVAAYWHRNPLRRLLYRLRGGSGKVRFHAGRSPASS